MKIVFTPDWFLNFDVMIGFFSFVILFLFSLFAYKSYKVSRKKSTLYLGAGFFLIALAEFSTILTKGVLYYDISMTTEIGRAVITQGVVESVDIFYHIGFFFHRFFTLFGLYVLYKLPTGRKKSTPADLLLTIYLILMTAILSNTFYYFFHLTAFLLLGLIIRDYYRIYRKERITNTLILVIAFSILAVSQLIFIFSRLESSYVAAQVLQVVSYVTLLILIIKIVKNGKEKKQDRHSV